MVTIKTGYAEGPSIKGFRRYSQPNKIGAATPYDFDGKNLTAYGGLLPVGHDAGETGIPATGRRNADKSNGRPRHASVSVCSGDGAGRYVGFSRLHHLRFLEREPMLTGILGVLRVPPQCTFWRFLASLHGGGAATAGGASADATASLGSRQREIESRGHVDTDTTVQTLFGEQMGARKGYNPQHKGKKSLSADFDVFGRDRGIRRRGIAQRTTARRANRSPRTWRWCSPRCRRW